jgi:alkanesulfonate monooxygenase SsuD/methylene tetrahydromethanopterin reductase-like flavin-dependent oxidoreductase (luciferase family)
VTAERLGYDAVIVPEGWGLDAGIVLATIAARTERIRLVAGVLSIWGRTPATVAMTAATLDRMSGGRFTLGLGTSTRALAEQFHGVTHTSPADRLEGFVDEVRTLLRGDRPAGPHGRRLRLGQPARPDLPIWVAGLGPRASAIASERADGWFPAVVPRDRLDQARRQLGHGRHSTAILACGPMAASTTGSFDGPAAARRLVGWYLTGMGTVYGDSVAAHGYAAEIAALRAANPRPSPTEVHWPDAADPLLEQLTATGDTDAIARQLEAWDKLADIVTVGVGPAPLDAILATIHAAAPTTAPRPALLASS